MRVHWLVFPSLLLAAACVSRSPHFNDNAQQVLGKQIVDALDHHSQLEVDGLFVGPAQLEATLTCKADPTLSSRRALGERYSLSSAPEGLHFRLISVDPSPANAVAVGGAVTDCTAKKATAVGGITVKFARVDVDGTKAVEELQLQTVLVGDRWQLLGGVSIPTPPADPAPAPVDDGVGSGSGSGG